MRKDGSGLFDGLGIRVVSIKSTKSASSWLHGDLPQSEILQFGDGIDQSDSILKNSIDDVYLQQLF